MKEIILDMILGAGGVSEVWELSAVFGPKQTEFCLKSLMIDGLIEFSPNGKIYALVPGSSGFDFEAEEFSAIFSSAFVPAEIRTHAA
ncbi:MAG: hypothetical protein WC708_01160 [Lentisphaeria bacterium]|jgi:hypothetical protein